MVPRSSLDIKADALLRKIMWRTLSKRLPLYLVTEYPKSGGTWFSQMLAEALQVPYPQNRRPRIEPCVMHGHELYSRSFHNVFCVVRDGRDAMCSAYFHLLSDHGRNPRLIRRMRDAMPFREFDDVRANMASFLEHMFTARERGPFKFTWAEFVRSWANSGAEIVKYEHLLTDSAATLGRGIENVLGRKVDPARLHEIARKYSFESQTRRKPGQEDTRSFLRKGVAGDWKEKFSPEARRIFDRYAGDELVLMGYEPDRSWVDRDDSGSAAESRTTESAAASGSPARD